MMSLFSAVKQGRTGSAQRFAARILEKARHPRFEHPQTVTQTVAAERDEHSPEAIRRRRGPDLRLLSVALSLWAAVASTVAWRSEWPALMCAGVAAAGVLAMLRSAPEGTHRVVGRSVLVSSLSAGMAAVGAWWRILRLDATPAISALKEGQTRTIVGDFPVAGTVKQLSEGRMLVPIDVPGMGTIPLFVNAERAQWTSGGERLQDLQPGQLIECAATLRWEEDSPNFLPVVASATRAVEWDAQAAPEGIWAVTAWLREGLSWASDWWPVDIAGLIPGMVMGDVSGQTPEVRQQFLVTGLSHLTAVSGANVSIVVGATLVTLTFLRCPPHVRILASACALGGFVLLVGPEPSVLRAAVMGSVGIVAVASARWSDVLAALSVAIILLLLLSPGLAVQYAFVLSVVATAGIVALAPWLSLRILRWWTHQCIDRWQREPIAAEALVVRFVCVAIAADVVTAPMIVLMTGRVSLTALWANLLVTAAVAPVTVVGLVVAPVAASIATAGLPHLLAGLLLAPAVPCAWWILRVANTLSAMPMLLTPGGAWWALLWAVFLATIIGSLVSFRRWRIWRWAWLGIALIMGCGVTVGTGGVGEERRIQWDPPARIDVSGAQVIRVEDDDAARRASASAVAEEEAGNGERPDLIVVTSCGRAHDRPSVTQEGIPVVYPCRDATTLTGTSME